MLNMFPDSQTNGARNEVNVRRILNIATPQVGAIPRTREVSSVVWRVGEDYDVNARAAAAFPAFEAPDSRSA